MTGQPAARISDAVKGGVIVTGSRTVLIGSQGDTQGRRRWLLGNTRATPQAGQGRPAFGSHLQAAQGPGVDTLVPAHCRWPGSGSTQATSTLSMARVVVCSAARWWH